MKILFKKQHRKRQKAQYEAQVPNVKTFHDCGTDLSEKYQFKFKMIPVRIQLEFCK